MWMLCSARVATQRNWNALLAHARSMDAAPTCASESKERVHMCMLQVALLDRHSANAAALCRHMQWAVRMSYAGVLGVLLRDARAMRRVHQRGAPGFPWEDILAADLSVLRTALWAAPQLCAERMQMGDLTAAMRRGVQSSTVEQAVKDAVTCSTTCAGLISLMRACAHARLFRCIPALWRRACRMQRFTFPDGERVLTVAVCSFLGLTQYDLLNPEHLEVTLLHWPESNLKHLVGLLSLRHPAHPKEPCVCITALQSLLALITMGVLQGGRGRGSKQAQLFQCIAQHAPCALRGVPGTHLLRLYKEEGDIHKGFLSTVVSGMKEEDLRDALNRYPPRRRPGAAAYALRCATASSTLRRALLTCRQFVQDEDAVARLAGPCPHFHRLMRAQQKRRSAKATRRSAPTDMGEGAAAASSS